MCTRVPTAKYGETVWPSGLRRWLQAPVRKGVGSNPTAVTCVGGTPAQAMSYLLPLSGSHQMSLEQRGERGVEAVHVRMPHGS